MSEAWPMLPFDADIVLQCTHVYLYCMAVRFATASKTYRFGLKILYFLPMRHE